MPVGTVTTSGLRELERTFKKLDKALAKDVRDLLKEVGGIVADEARSIAGQKGLRKSGDLIRSIRPSVRGTAALVRAGAVHRGFNYPRRLEFEGGRRGASDPMSFRGSGPRAFLRPGLESKQAEVLDAFEQMLDVVGRNFEKKG